MKIRAIIGGIINYILAIACSVVFELFLNANVGRFVLLALLFAPALSVFFAWLSSRMVSVSIEMEDALLSKGDKCSMTIHLRNDSIFPTSPIEVKMADTPRVLCEDTDIMVSVLPRTSKSFEVKFKAKICGKSMVGVKEVRVTDYLGLFSFPIMKVDYDSQKKKVAVIPNIAEISARDDNIMQAMQASRNMDDSEDTVESSVVTFGGFPGYDSREYVPGDPLKRINWKQSAKRDKLLVRLDDEVSSQTIHVVLDSVYEGDNANPKIAEDAVENALGIIRVLIRHDYTVNYYAMGKYGFAGYQIEDEMDLENVRLEMAEYVFAGKEDSDKGIERFPSAEILGKGEGAFLFSTPNSLGEAAAAVEGQSENIHVTIYSAAPAAAESKSLMEQSVSQNSKGMKVVYPSGWKKFFAVVRPLAASYFLALLLSISVFSVFNVPIISVWTLLQTVVCAGCFAICFYVNRHRVIGTMLMTVLVMALLSIYARIVFHGDYGITYTHWFLSGGESVDSSIEYLLSLVVVFTVFFSVVVYYFSNVLYRTSFLMLVSLIPFLIHVKVMHDINMVPVVFITVLNVVVLLMHTRKNRDDGKRIVGYIAGFVSVGFYALVFVLIGLAAPKQEDTRYYYVFENAFMGGNISEALPESYSTLSSFSGNADNFNELNNRKLYEVSVTGEIGTLYLKRQNFDLYDFEHDRWYAMEKYALHGWKPGAWSDMRRDMDLGLLADAMECVEGYEPGFLEKYGLNRIDGSFEERKYSMEISATNFPSESYLTTARTVEIQIPEDIHRYLDSSMVSHSGVYQTIDGSFLDRNLTYTVDFYNDFTSRNRWIAQGGSNMDTATALDMLEEMGEILLQAGETQYLSVVNAYISDAHTAQTYGEDCEENNELIPDSVKELAQEITKGCTYDWEKALALQNYFQQNEFIYDLSYKAPDDSVEYFLFKGKTGTCSDFASAYVLMARAAGLTARYTEGFAPEQEYEDLYVVRTNCGHAYPEVYIQNVGFVVYEATMPASYRNTSNRGSGIMFYLMRVGVRTLIILTLVSCVIMALLFLRMILEPLVRELWFGWKMGKAEPGQAVVMIYKRITKRHMGRIIQNAGAYTPYEYAAAFEQKMGYDMSGITFMLEDAAYHGKPLNEEDKKRARYIYKDAVAALRRKKREWAKERWRRHGK